MNVTDAGGQPVLTLRFSADAQGIAPEEGQEIRALGLVHSRQADVMKVLVVERLEQPALEHMLALIERWDRDRR